MTTYDFLVDDPSDAIVIASTEADSPKEACALLQPLYEPHSLLWLPDDQEDHGPNSPASSWRATSSSGNA
jgi:hypothetical protein